MKRLISWSLLSLLLTSCFSSNSFDLERAETLARAKHFPEALKYFNRVIEREPRSERAVVAAREAARISYFEVRSFEPALVFYHHLVLHSPNGEERKEAQKKIAMINFEHLTDYKASIAEFNKLLDLAHSPDDEFTYRFNVAKSYYFLNNFYQAQAELNTLLKHPIGTDQKFEALVLKANIWLAMKKMDEAAETYLKVMHDFPERSQKESVALNLAVCYEEQKKFNEAIATLTALRNHYNQPEFIDMRIARLKERASYLPGAKGLKK